ncbi:hypothetical protein L5F09_02685 [Aliarcobacter butzleri]|uniref:hypothetical protein n=1 Tax=Aliarcobacter butzleri TaxID=28197 RepID=UPI001EDA51AB|nr:hypothetical protein [Aliarcobacter butzleri]MCG3664648.1 hypothetical protein [Aliarcobacter butzleri]
MTEIKYFEDFKNNKLHLDIQDNLLAYEHLGFYLNGYLTNSSNKNGNNRIYFSSKHKKEYYEKKVEKGFYKYKRYRDTKYILIKENTTNIEAKNILSILYQLFKNEKLTVMKTQTLLNGLSIVLNYLKQNNISIENANDISIDTQYEVYDLCKNWTDRRSVSEFFTFLSSKVSSFVKKDYLAKLNRSEENSVKSLSSVVMFQLSECAKKELDELFSSMKKYKNWIENSNKILTQKNILKSLIYEYCKSGNRKNLYKDILRLSLDEIHLKMLMPFNIKILEFNLLSKDLKNKNKIEKENILKYLENAIVFDKDIKLYCILINLVEKDYPFDTTIKDKYKEISNYSGYRRLLTKILNTNAEDVKTMSVSTIYLAYPMFLLSQLESGKNNEVLYDWKVNKVDDGYILGDKRELCISIEGYKHRSESGTSITLVPYDSTFMKYINLYLEHTKNIYDKSQTKNFFQYFNYSSNNNNPIISFDKNSISNYKLLESNIYKKYEIIDNSGNRIKDISHRGIRKAFNYQMHLQGKNEFERQIKNEHKDSAVTRKYYEVDYNWQQDKRIRLGDALNDIMDNIFSGKILKKELDYSSLGLISDCTNNLKPSYIGFSKLKKGYLCSDWKKCLTQCSNSIVIPKIHGPAIMAWKDYLLELNEELSLENFIKEGYAYDLTAVKEVLVSFSKEELANAEENKDKYYNLVRVDIPISHKIS